METTETARHVAYLAPELGAVSSTFVYREIAALRARGFRVSLFSTRRPSDHVMSAEAKPFADETTYLYEASVGAVLLGVSRFKFRHPIRYIAVVT